MIVQKQQTRYESLANQYFIVIIVSVLVISIFLVRIILGKSINAISLFNIFNFAILFLSIGILILNYKLINQIELIIILIVGLFFGSLITFTSFFPIIPFDDPILISISHGVSIAIILSAGIILLNKQNGPVQIDLLRNKLKKSLIGLVIGLLIGLPFAIINVIGFSLMNGESIIVGQIFESVFSAMQPAFVEEIIYRFTLISMFYFLFTKYNQKFPLFFSCLIALMIHNYAHLTDLFIAQPVFALIYGSILALLFGLPLTFLAIKINLESSISFHWIVDFFRFACGF